MGNIFMGRSLAVIEDLTLAERRYLFEQTKILKDALERQDQAILDRFRINDPDFGMYEVFLEASTRTRESFRNAAKFHRAKVSDLATESSSFNKGESYADTFNTLAGYHNSVFIIRSKLEGVCRWLEEEASAFALRNKLSRKPAFINAGDGRHEHPTQELLDDFTFLEDNNWNADAIHLAVVGDLYHGRTVHSKADGLRIFNSVKIDLIAPPELAMPESYRIRMEENGFAIRTFDSIAEYLRQKDVANIWYFTRPQLERMGEQILKREEELRGKVTFRREFIDLLPPHTKFYHPLPRHREHPTIPTFLDDTPLNGWERQSINGMYVRIVLLALVAGKIGSDFTQETNPKKRNDEEYIIQVDTTKTPKKIKEDAYSEGVRPIHDGLVIDHICRGDDPASIRRHMGLISRVLGLDDGKGGEWVSTSKSETGLFKGIIFRPGARDFDRKDLKRLAAAAAGCTLNIIREGRVVAKYRTHLPPRIYNFDDLSCNNEDCISHPIHAEGVPPRFERTNDDRYACAYCDTVHTFKEIWK
ncbi:MAG: bifunctional aspartate carbamoyltransferase catalytic subunit/aspartate carbamoyltransferase regulatory subunit [Sphaerochaetaceae bacterium]|nr:bifunctional aspartate carbamoyltransferase catalytic subunit/aspartate carbamoyltransferase regulatory subunit [Sphaerochaetaceae bacterium]